MPGAAFSRTARWIVVASVLALALAIPAVTLAAGGGSAGDQQYTDPFAGSPTTATTTPTHTQTATSTPTATSAPPTPSASATTPQSTVTLTSNDPTATTAHQQLPYTGYDSWLAGALGFSLVGAGVVVRRRARRA
ncbi:MAG: LPXTG cell wall anchor domain-containing protein [Solirubrobacteraceae bacterium]